MDQIRESCQALTVFFGGHVLVPEGNFITITDYRTAHVKATFTFQLEIVELALCQNLQPDLLSQVFSHSLRLVFALPDGFAYLNAHGKRSNRCILSDIIGVNRIAEYTYHTSGHSRCRTHHL